MLHELIEQIGRDKAIRFYKLCQQALNQLHEIADTLDVSAEFTRRNSLYFASERSHVSITGPKTTCSLIIPSRNRLP
ncbi:hypothetical protein D3C81_1777750 [compost metagenome]